MEIKRIVVCGDSFCSADVNHPGHFSELLTKHGYEVINIARGGISNTAIFFQLAEAIKLNASCVIFRKTHSGRIDIPLKKFIPSLGLKNFIYPYPTDSSFGSEYVGNSDAAIYSDVVPDILINRWDQTVHIPDDVKEAVKHYITKLQDVELLTIKDSWIFNYWTTQLALANIPYIEITSTGIGKEIYKYIKDHLPFPCIYHTDTTTQQLVAESILQELKNLSGSS